MVIMKKKPISREQVVAVLDALGCDEVTRMFSPFGREATVSVGMSEMEKCQMALTKLLVPEFNARGVRPFESLSKAYVHFTGDSDLSGNLRPNNASPGIRSSQDFDSNTFTFALMNAMNVYLSMMFKDFPYHEGILISKKINITDFRAITAIQLQYFGELPDLDPETGDYENLGPYIDTKAEYRLGQKGAIVWVTRRHIIDNAIVLVQDMVKRMAKAARLAHAKYAWKFYIDNALCPDGTAWFTGGHGNLGSSALDITPLVTSITALANMTEPGLSEEKIGLDLATFNWNMVVPISMWDLAVKKNLSEGSYFSSNDLTTKVPNPCQKLFGDRNERIITCPFMTDANDWGVIRDKEDVPILEMAYMNGHEEPEFIPEWIPKTVGSNVKAPLFTFKDDKLGFKVRHEYGGTLAGFQGGYKSIVAP
jgi:hypothetical protein